MNNSNKKIGVFDSGLGGLTVLRKLLVDYPAHYLYVADTANIPFGSKSLEQLQHISAAIVQFLYNQGVHDCIIACHTASVVLPFLQQTFPAMHFVAVIDPVVEAAIIMSKENKIGIIATPATIASHVHRTRLLAKNPSLLVIEQASHRLVPCIEGRSYNAEALLAILQEDLQPFKECGIDTLILGSTHYSIIKEQIQKIVGKKIIPVAAEDRIIRYLSHNTMQNGKSFVDFFVTGDPQLFKEKSETMLAFPLPNAVKKVIL